MGLNLALAGVGLLGSAFSSRQQSKAAGQAAGAQTAAAQAGLEEQRRQFDALQARLAPYTEAGAGALTAQQALLGLSGQEAQRGAISGIEASPQFQALRQQGESSILANASATGGLRGGNVQGALAQFSPALLAQLIEQQYGRLGGLTSMGQNAAAGVGNAGMQTGMNIANLLQQQGAATAGGALAQGQARAGLAGGITNALGLYAGMGGFGAGSGQFTRPGLFSGYSNPAGETYDYRGAVLPNVLRGGG